MSPPRRVEGRDIELQIDAEKIIVRIQTRFRPESYMGVHSVIVMGDILPNQLLKLYYSFSYYICGNMFVVEIDKLQITEWLDGFNAIAVSLLGRRFEIYTYRADDFIWLTTMQPEMSTN